MDTRIRIKASAESKEKIFSFIEIVIEAMKLNDVEPNLALEAFIELIAMFLLDTNNKCTIEEIVEEIKKSILEKYILYTDSK